MWLWVLAFDKLLEIAENMHVFSPFNLMPMDQWKLQTSPLAGGLSTVERGWMRRYKQTVRVAACVGGD